MIQRAGSLLLSLACLLLAPTVAAAPAAVPIRIGETHLVSFAEGDRRPVNVYLPEGYTKGGKRYPVLYLIDGGLSQDFLCLAPREDLMHATAYHVLSPQALQFLFPTNHKNDPEWGFEVPCSKRS